MCRSWRENKSLFRTKENHDQFTARRSAFEIIFFISKKLCLLWLRNVRVILEFWCRPKSFRCCESCTWKGSLRFDICERWSGTILHPQQMNIWMQSVLMVRSSHVYTSLYFNFSIQLGSSTITPSRTARNLGVVIDDQLSFTDHIATTARSCRFALYNIRKIRPFLSEQAAQLLVQALVLSRLDYCNALLAGLPACTIKPLQLIQNAAARVVFNEPKKAHVTPLFIRLHWLPIAARIKFKVLMFAYKTTTGTAPIYLNSLVQTYAPSRSLRSASERRLVVPSQRGTKSLSRTFTWTVPSWWNDLPISIRTAESLAIFKKHLKTHLFASTWLTNTNTYLFYLKKKKKKKKNNPSYVYCARLTETCHGTCILLLSRWSDCFYCSPHLYVALDKSVC